MASDDKADDDTTADSWEHAEDPDEIVEILPEGWQERLEDPSDTWRGKYEPPTGEPDYFPPDWDAIGRVLWEARNRLGISKREAARRAGLSEGAWRHLEAGKKIVNRTAVDPNPRNENLVAAARAVEVRPELLFEMAGRELPPGLVEPPSEEQTIRDFRRLSHNDRQLVDRLITRLLGEG